MMTIRSQITRAVLGYFFLHEAQSLHVNGLARRLSLDSGNLARKLIQLENEGILKSQWQGGQRTYSLNKDFSLFKEYRQIILQTVGIEAMLKTALQAIPNVRRAVIFGSYARHAMDRSSDIDLLVVGDHSAVDLQKVIAGIQQKIDREINVVSMTEGEFQKKSRTDPFLKSITQKKGVTLV